MSHKYLQKKKSHGWIWAIVVFLAIILAAAAAFYYLVIDNIGLEMDLEAGQEPDLTTFMERKWDIPITFEEGFTQPDWSRPGDYLVKLSYCRLTYDAMIHVRDTISPKGETMPITVYAIFPPAAEDFVTYTEDVTDVSIAFGVQPDLTKEGTQQISILLTDEGGNTTELYEDLTLLFDKQAPEITGARESITIYQGDTIAYREGITVTDDQDEEPDFTIDTDGVDLSTPGEYIVTYIASDDFGNTTTVDTKITVLEKRENYVDLDTIHEAVASRVAKIVTDDMTVEEQVRAIYKWIRNNSNYVNHSEKDDYRQTGYLMLTTHRGDCFGYFALAKLMYEELGIPNIDVEKVKNHSGDSLHYWSLVSVDGGETYYHVDCCPRSGDPFNGCLRTDAQLDSYSNKHNHSHNRDKSLYPATPEDPL